MNILAIETSCDETAVAILKNEEVCSHKIASQIQSHQKYGGVVPEVASRLHTEWIPNLISSALQEAQLKIEDIQLIAVTQGPGLEGSLIVGTIAAKSLSAMHSISLIPINHIEAHMFAAFFGDNQPSFPFVSLIVSGGHTLLVKVNKLGDYELLGETRDDAAGEAFDKIARACGLPYPGGPHIQKKAETGDPKRFSFPIPLKHNLYEFSFSGLKTAVIQTIRSHEEKKDEQFIHDICASFQSTVIKTLSLKAQNACRELKIKDLVICGGVTANTPFRNHMKTLEETDDLNVWVPGFEFCTDNAAMIGLTGYMYHKMGKVSQSSFTVNPNLSLSYS